LLAQGAQVALNREGHLLALAGKRVVITRPQQADGSSGDELGAELQKQGAQPIYIPTIELVPTIESDALQKAVGKIENYDWLIFTSPNAVEFFWSQMPAGTIEQIGESTKIGAVGPATKAALWAWGLNVDAMPSIYLGLEITSAVGKVFGKRILLPRSAQAGSELPAQFRQLGAEVVEIAVYTPMPVELNDAARATLASGVDVVTFASASAVRAFVNAVRSDERLVNFWRGVTVACIGPSTAEAARSERFNVQVVATEHTSSGLVSALTAYFEKEPTHG
jgi:uroporphyrinogen-III synthase